MQKAFEILKDLAPELEIDGEMRVDTALNPQLRHRLLAQSRLKGAANLLLMPNMDAADISLNMAKVLGEGLTMGPI